MITMLINQTYLDRRVVGSFITMTCKLYIMPVNVLNVVKIKVTLPAYTYIPLLFHQIY